MAIQVYTVGNDLAQIVPVLENSGLFHAVSYDSADHVLICRGADGNPRLRIEAGFALSAQTALFRIYVSAGSSYANSGSVATVQMFAVNRLYACRNGVIFDCVSGAVLVTKNQAGEILTVMTDWQQNTAADAFRNLRVHSYGDVASGNYPVNLVLTPVQRENATLFVPFVSESADPVQAAFSPDAFCTPVCQFTENGAVTVDGRTYLVYRGCFAIADD